MVLGDSITYGGEYVDQFELFLRANFPDRRFEVLDLGLPSETVSGLSEEGHAGGKFPRPDLHERLERVLAKTKPDLVTACYGMNDGIYLPFDEPTFLAKSVSFAGERWTERYDRALTDVLPPPWSTRSGSTRSARATS